MSVFSRSSFVLSLFRCVRRQQFSCLESLDYIRTAQSTAAAARTRCSHSWSARCSANYNTKHIWTSYQRNLSSEVSFLCTFFYRGSSNMTHDFLLCYYKSAWHFSPSLTQLLWWLVIFRHHLKKMSTHLYQNTLLRKRPRRKKCSSSVPRVSHGHVLQKT